MDFVATLRDLESIILRGDGRETNTNELISLIFRIQRNIMLE